MPYVNCPNCGQKALTVATRCPQCGLPFESQFILHQGSGPKPRRGLALLLAVGAVVALVVVEVLRHGFQATTLAPAPVMVLDSAPPPVPQPPAESLPTTSSDSAPSVAPAPARPVAAAPAPAPIVSTPTERRYASNWVNVRAERSNLAAVVRILRPGETLLVDSLARGWYRVVADQKVVGYVDSHFLASSPPPAAP